MIYVQQTIQDFSPLCDALLVLKDNVRKPNYVEWNTNNINAIIIRCIPNKAIIYPLLQMTFEEKVSEDITCETTMHSEN